MVAELDRRKEQSEDNHILGVYSNPRGGPYSVVYYQHHFHNIRHIDLKIVKIRLFSWNAYSVQGSSLQLPASSPSSEFMYGDFREE